MWECCTGACMQECFWRGKRTRVECVWCVGGEERKRRREEEKESRRVVYDQIHRQRVYSAEVNERGRRRKKKAWVVGCDGTKHFARTAHHTWSPAFACHKSTPTSQCRNHSHTTIHTTLGVGVSVRRLSDLSTVDPLLSPSPPTARMRLLLL